ncbi:ABC transporter G family member 11-like [Punica granatum]|uniref:ABC transporter G family member 11-like n=1 Tax=Punica granatum TaxID=22663 RepID=A0A218VUN4_PUNGR|nr:ABC transporter G family member 11-like [Punica granatum]OWM63612.1 hypothetical protein CDL15_Pgr008155 [Punica granatum]
MASLLNLMNQDSSRLSLRRSEPSSCLEIESFPEAQRKEYPGHDDHDLNIRNGVYITWEDLWVTVPNIGGASDKPILQGLTGYARPGELLAIMGPSGCGKTTLLDALAGRLSMKINKTGDILINGQKQALAYGTSAYVTQDETLVTTLTVREAVHYSAQLQLPESMSNAEKRERADGTIREMGLKDTMDTVIGSSWGPVGKGLSSGQKRRVSICLELLTHPKLLFLDEPTSGLDSAASYYVMKRIAALNHKSDGIRRTIIASIHQPSTEVFQLFDYLCLLSCGKAIYFGPASSANQFFASAGFPCPILQNPSDHFLETINKDFATDVEEGLEVSVEEAIETLRRLYRSSPYYLEVVGQVAEICKQGAEGHGRLKVEEQGSKASFLTQCSVLTRRSSVNMYRDKGYYMFRVVIYLAIALSMGTQYYKVGFAYESIQARGSLIMFISAFLNYMAVGGFPSFVEDMKVYIRERLNGHYGTSAFVVANAISSIPYILFLSVVSGTIIYYLPGMHEGIGCFLYFLGLLFTSMMAVESMMMVIASIVPNFLMGIIAATGVQGLMILGAGIYRLPKDIPKPFWKYPIYYIALHRYAYQGLCKNEFEGLEFQIQLDGTGQHMVGGKQILRDYFQIESYSKWVDLWVLLGMLVFYRLLFFAIIKLNEIVKPKMAALMAVRPKQATQVMESPAP